MNRFDLRRLAEERLADAKVLLEAERWTAAYYLSGYSLECGLKACLLVYLDKTGKIFEDRGYLRSLADCWTHDLERLIGLAGLKQDHGNQIGLNSSFRNNWSIAKDWKETSRYDEITKEKAEGLFKAIADVPDGVYQWIQRYW